LRRVDQSSRVVLQECGASECDREATVMRGPWPTRGCCAIGGGGFKNFEYVVRCSRCVKEGSIQASWCVLLPFVTPRVHECSNVCFCVCKMRLFMSICNKTENKRNVSGINLNVMLKINLTKPRI
jgi:hypothetical protein